MRESGWTLGLLAVYAYLLNLLWEWLHYPLYICPIERGTCTSLAALLDVGMVLVIVLVCYWLLGLVITRKHYLAAAFFGFVWGYIVELRALLADRWVYAPGMPLVPFLHVGWSPLLQMTVLVPLSLWLAVVTYARLCKK